MSDPEDQHEQMERKRQRERAIAAARTLGGRDHRLAVQGVWLPLERAEHLAQMARAAGEGTEE